MSTTDRTTIEALCLGADPGASGGLALVSRSAADHGLDLIGAWWLRGSDLRRRCESAHFAVTEATRLAGGLRLVPECVVDTVAHSEVWIEEPPPASREGTLDGDKRGQRTWCGVGRYQGILAGEVLRYGWPIPELVEHAAWTAAHHPLVRRRKDGDGRHRLREASQLVRGAGDLLSTIGRTGQVEVAEAILIAAAGAATLRRRRVA